MWMKFIIAFALSISLILAQNEETMYVNNIYINILKKIIK